MATLLHTDASAALGYGWRPTPSSPDRLARTASSPGDIQPSSTRVLPPTRIGRLDLQRDRPIPRDKILGGPCTSCPPCARGKTPPARPGFSSLPTTPSWRRLKAGATVDVQSATSFSCGAPRRRSGRVPAAPYSSPDREEFMALHQPRRHPQGQPLTRPRGPLPARRFDQAVVRTHRLHHYTNGRPWPRRAEERATADRPLVRDRLRREFQGRSPWTSEMSR